MSAKKKSGEKANYKKSFNRGVQNTGHLGRFIELLTYKAKLMGKRAIVIDERGTSKTCAFCRYKKLKMPLYQRVYQCENCGNVIDRDQNSALNIMKRFLSINAVCTGYQQFLQTIGNLRSVNDKMKVSSSSGSVDHVGSPLIQ